MIRSDAPLRLAAERVREAMVAHAVAAAPEEACGLLAVDADRVVRMAYCLSNLDRSRYRFTVDPSEHYGAWRHATAVGWDIGGVFHSHPTGPAFPSATDVSAAPDPGWWYVVVGLAQPDDPEVRAFTIADGRVAEVAIAVGVP